MVVVVVDVAIFAVVVVVVLVVVVIAVSVADSDAVFFVVVVCCDSGGIVHLWCCCHCSNISFSIGYNVITVNIISSVSGTAVNVTPYVIISIYFVIGAGGVGDGGW